MRLAFRKTETLHQLFHGSRFPIHTRQYHIAAGSPFYRHPQAIGRLFHQHLAAPTAEARFIRLSQTRSRLPIDGFRGHWVFQTDLNPHVKAELFRSPSIDIIYFRADHSHIHRFPGHPIRHSMVCFHDLLCQLLRGILRRQAGIHSNRPYLLTHGVLRDHVQQMIQLALKGLLPLLGINGPDIGYSAFPHQFHDVTAFKADKAQLLRHGERQLRPPLL